MFARGISPAKHRRSLLQRLFNTQVNYGNMGGNSHIRVDNVQIITHQPNVHGLQINIVKLSGGHMITLCYPFEDDGWGNPACKPEAPDMVLVPEDANLIEALTAAIVKAKLK